MRNYDLSSSTLALFDLPKTKYDQVKESLFERIARQLLIFDAASGDEMQSVLEEINSTLHMPDPAFEITFHNIFEDRVEDKSFLGRWHKISQDYSQYISSEGKRRNKENPYFPKDHLKIESWDDLPDFSRQKSNQPWQFDVLYKDAQYLSGSIYEFVKNFKQSDKDLLRAKFYGILVPAKIIFALNNSEYMHNFAEREISIIDIKLSLDAYKLAYTFTNRVIETMHKIRWSISDQKEFIDSIIASADLLNQKILNRIQQMERRFLLYIEANYDEE